MPKFLSLRPLPSLPIADDQGEPLATFHKNAIGNKPNIFDQDIELPRATGTQALSGENEQYFRANSINPMYSVPSVQFAQSSIIMPKTQAIPSRYIAIQTNPQKALQPLKSAQTLESYRPQSLITALQLTMEPKTNREPIIIPAEMKKTKWLPVTQELSPVTRRKISRFKLGIVLGAMTAFMFLTAFSLGPASQGKDTIPFVNNIILLVQTQQQGLTSAISHTASAPTTQDTTLPAADVPAMPAIPQNDLVMLAQQDAVKYGISPVYFVRQIYAESGFNPNAYSPAGAVGIAQFLPSTAAGLGIDPYDPVSALDGSAKLMASLNNQFGGNYAKALAGYNAGPGAVQTAVNNGGANWLALMPYETQAYIQKIMG